MNQQLHLVLGGYGAIGRAVLQELRERQIPVKAVERSKKVPGIETIQADLSDIQQAINAIQGVSHVYLCIGIPYNAKIWAAEWPVVMTNVIAACEKAGANLIFFDNVYLYGPPPLSVPFAESHPQKPSSSKGKTRKRIADMLLDAHNEGRIKAVIGRSADFYGPDAVNSIWYIQFLERMLQGKAPRWIGRPKIPHTYAYTLDNGRALVALALDEGTYGQAWHLPVGLPVTIEQVAELFNQELNTSLHISFLPRVMLGLISLGIPPIQEAKEMLYQFDHPYVLSYDKFKEHFPSFRATPYEEGIRVMIRSFKDG